MRLYGLAAAVLLALLPAGCGKVEELRQEVEQGQAQAGKVAAALKNPLGADDIHVMVNMLNGGLAQVTVVLDPKQVGGKTVSEIDAAVRAAVQQEFGRQPQQLSIMLVATQTE